MKVKTKRKIDKLLRIIIKTTKKLISYRVTGYVLLAAVALIVFMI